MFIPPMLDNKRTSKPSVFAPAALLGEARRQKGLDSLEVPPVCILDPDGDLARRLRQTGLAMPFSGTSFWPTWEQRYADAAHGPKNSRRPMPTPMRDFWLRRRSTASQPHNWATKDPQPCCRRCRKCWKLRMLGRAFSTNGEEVPSRWAQGQMRLAAARSGGEIDRRGTSRGNVAGFAEIKPRISQGIRRSQPRSLAHGFRARSGRYRKNEYRRCGCRA
jgi:hypothetical protein